jgi:hypothetical protein
MDDNPILVHLVPLDFDDTPQPTKAPKECIWKGCYLPKVGATHYCVKHYRLAEYWKRVAMQPFGEE